MRLLLISQDFPPDVGGTQTYAYELARRLAKHCEDFAVIAPALPGADTVDATLPCEVIRVSSTPNNFGLKVWSAARKMGRRGFDAALHVQWSSAPATIFAAHRLGGPRRIFVAAHGRELLLDPLAGVPVLRALYGCMRAYVLRHADAFFPVSHYTRQLLLDQGISAKRISVIHNGADPDKFHPVDAQDLRDALGLTDHKIVLTVSRLVQRKGIDTVLRALPQEIRRRPDVRYLIGGDGPDRQRLETIAQELNLTDRVHFIGSIPHADLRRYYNVCDVFVMPSREEKPHVEGFGITFLEANACGKPVVGARTGGIPDAIHHGETGLLVEPDDEAALAEALVRLLCDEALARDLGQNGLTRVRNEASWDHVARQIYEVMDARMSE